MGGGSPGGIVAKHVILASVVLVASLLAATPAMAVGETCDGKVPTKVGTLAPDVLVGTNGDDVIAGLDGDDLIYGLLGNDTLCGDAGSDLLVGNSGNDRLFGGLDGDLAGGDLIWPGSGDDYVDAGLDPARTGYGLPVDTLSYADLALPTGAGVRVDLTPVAGLGIAVKPTGTDRIVVAGLLAVVGTPAADVLIGSPYVDVLVGRGGADAINGAAGTDSLVAGVSADSGIVLPAGDGPDVVDGGPGDDQINSGLGGGTTRGGEGHDMIVVQPASAPISVWGGDGRDTIDAFDVEDLDVDAGPDDDSILFSLFPDAGDVVVAGGGGRDIGQIKLGKTAFRRGSAITLDQRRGLVRTDVRIGAVREFEELAMNGVELHWTYRGTDAAERVVVRGARSLHARTRGGRDEIYGTKGRDVLDLGSGRDFAVGRAGRDVCIAAEKAVGCEVRR